MYRNAASQEGPQYVNTNYLYRRYSRDGDVLDSLGVFLEGETIRETTTITNPTTGETGRGMMSAGAPYGRDGTTIAHGIHLYHGSGGTFEIQAFTREGTLARLIRRPIPNPNVTEQDKDRLREVWLESGNDWMERKAPELEFPDTKPAFGTIKVDVLGNVWVAEYNIGREYDTGAWTVFDPDGRLLGVVQIRPGGRVTDIGEDYVMGVWRTDMDVQQVRMYAFTKGDVGLGR